MNREEARCTLGHCRALIDKLHRDCNDIKATVNCIEDYLTKISNKCAEVDSYLLSQRLRNARQREDNKD